MTHPKDAEYEYLDVTVATEKFFSYMNDTLAEEGWVLFQMLPPYRKEYELRHEDYQPALFRRRRKDT